MTATGVNVSAQVGPTMPSTGVAGVIVKALLPILWPVAASGEQAFLRFKPPVASVDGVSYGSISVTVPPDAAMARGHAAGADLKEAYEQLRQQMLSEGLPFLGAAELEREIAERKGTRS